MTAPASSYTPPMLELRGVAKRFGETQAVKPLSLAIPEGSTTVLIGPSGCGKSTLLRMLVGLAPPDQGDVLFDGAPLSGQLAQARRRIGYVIQDGSLFPHLTARENICLMPDHLGWTAQARTERVEALAALTRFPAERLDAWPAELSGGQRQRVAIMRALALDPHTSMAWAARMGCCGVCPPRPGTADRGGGVGYRPKRHCGRRLGVSDLFGGDGGCAPRDCLVVTPAASLGSRSGADFPDHRFGHCRHRSQTHDGLWLANRSSSVGGLHYFGARKSNSGRCIR